MARHPMSSSWPQLTARSSVSGQSSTARVTRRHHRADGSKHDLHRRPGRRHAATPDGVHDAGAHRLWIGVQPRVSRRSHPAPCSAIRFQALLSIARALTSAQTPGNAPAYITPGAGSDGCRGQWPVTSGLLVQVLTSDVYTSNYDDCLDARAALRSEGTPV